ncbi:hypothetical protein [Phenylobacterium sp.]|uniref:hypothetical protein n=1 Tax=Phenylobacterium sp. TaxID=1871053 RepID=UPI0026092DD5|nr:hypothetical protein [Phenylobacterium sp.]
MARLVHFTGMKQIPGLRLASLGLAAVLLSGCLVSTPEDMETPSPDGQFVLDVAFRGGGLTLRPGLGAELSLRHVSGAETAVATLDAVRSLGIAWTGARALRICAEDAEPADDASVVVETPAGPETFTVTYACPAQPSPEGFRS